MQSLRMSVAVLILPATAYLGAVLGRADLPTVDAPPAAQPFPAGLANFGAVNLIVDQDFMANATTGDCDATTPTPYNMISLAVAAAMPGQTIGVCPGLYPEQVSINKTLRLLGAQ